MGEECVVYTVREREGREGEGGKGEGRGHTVCTQVQLDFILQSICVSSGTMYIRRDSLC